MLYKYGDYNDLVIETMPDRAPSLGEGLVRPMASWLTFVEMSLIKQFSVVGVRAGEYGRLNTEGGCKSRQAIFGLAEKRHLILPYTLPYSR